MTPAPQLISQGTESKVKARVPSTPRRRRVLTIYHSAIHHSSQANIDRMFFFRVNSSAFVALIDCINKKQEIFMKILTECKGIIKDKHCYLCTVASNIISWRSTGKIKFISFNNLCSRRDMMYLSNYAVQT